MWWYTRVRIDKKLRLLNIPGMGIPQQKPFTGLSLFYLRGLLPAGIITHALIVNS